MKNKRVLIAYLMFAGFTAVAQLPAAEPFPQGTSPEEVGTRLALFKIIQRKYVILYGKIHT